VTDFELFLSQLGFIPKPQPVAVEVVRPPPNDWYKRGEECPF
jgi:hypothetical protein